MKIQHHRIDTNVVVGLLVREFRCSGTDVSAKVLAMYAGTRTSSMEPQWLAAGLSQDRLKDVGGKILLVGVGHERNTYIHSVEEVLNVPNRLSDMPVLMKIVQHGKKPVYVYMRKHYNSQQPHISENFVKLNRAFDECGATVHTVFGSAECILCDARRIFEVTRHVIAPDPECLVTGGEIAPERWQELIR